MGVFISGHMIVGAFGGDITLPEGYNFYTEWAEENNLNTCSQHYDADSDSTIYGYIVDDIEVKDLDDNWLVHVKYLADKFFQLTGVEATLYGTRDVS